MSTIHDIIIYQTVDGLAVAVPEAGGQWLLFSPTETAFDWTVHDDPPGEQLRLVADPISYSLHDRLMVYVYKPFAVLIIGMFPGEPDCFVKIVVTSTDHMAKGYPIWMLALFPLLLLNRGAATELGVDGPPAWGFDPSTGVWTKGEDITSVPSLGLDDYIARDTSTA